MDSASLEPLTLTSVSAACAVNSADARCFPLPLSEFEEYMLCDDRLSHPMVIVMLADVSGLLREAEFRASVAALLRRQPLLRCSIQSDGGRPAWVPLVSIPDPVIWQCVGAANPSESVPAVEPLDVRAGRGVRIRVWFSPVVSRISFELHHACADGISAVQLLNELFVEYSSRTGGVSTPPSQTAAEAAEALFSRSPLQKSAASGSDSAARATPLSQLPGKLARLLFRRPVQIADSHQRSHENGSSAAAVSVTVSSHPAILVHSLPEHVVGKLRTAAAQQDVGLNDLLLLEIFRHVTDWNLQAGCGSDRSWVRIAVPVSMRSPRNVQLPACNLVSYALVTHRMRDSREPRRLLQQIHEKTMTMRSGRDGLIALKIFRLLRRVPWGVRTFLSLWPCAGTLVLANVGNVIRRCRLSLPLDNGRWIAGNISVERICGVPPVRPNTLVAIGFTEYAGQLHVSLRTDGTRLNVADSEQFLNQFTARLEQPAVMNPNGPG